MTKARYWVVTMLFVVGTTWLPAVAFSQATSTFTPPRTADGQPDLQGVWRAWNLAKHDVEAHSASEGVPAGLGVVVDPADGRIPYKEWARAKRNENFAKSRISDPYDPLKNADPLSKCYLPGFPRMTYLGFPFIIWQSKDFVGFEYEWHHNSRYVPLPSVNRKKLDPEWEFFNGLNRGRWEGNTLVVDITNLNDHVWLDQAGNFYSKTAHVVERYTRTGPDRMTYEVTIEDPRIYTRPWTMRMTLHRQDEPILDYECAALLEQSGIHVTWDRELFDEVLEPKD